MDVDRIDVGPGKVVFPHAERVPALIGVVVATHPDLEQVEPPLTHRREVRLIVSQVIVGAPLVRLVDTPQRDEVGREKAPDEPVATRQGPEVRPTFLRQGAPQGRLYLFGEHHMT